MPWIKTTVILRSAHRGGASSSTDYLAIYSAATSCYRICSVGMNFGGLYDKGTIPSTYGSDPYYLKCFDAAGRTPLNDKRIQFSSQEGSLEFDPALPRMNVTDFTGCMRKLQFFQEVLGFEKGFTNNLYYKSIYYREFHSLPIYCTY